jgi:hypothetical protein
VTRSEPRWTDQDRGEALALALYRDGLCPLCGKPVDVCTSHEETGPSFEVEYIACRATMAKIEKQRALFGGDDKKPDPYAPSYLWAVTTRR